MLFHAEVWVFASFHGDGFVAEGADGDSLVLLGRCFFVGAFVAF